MTMSLSNVKLRPRCDLRHVVTLGRGQWAAVAREDTRCVAQPFIASSRRQTRGQVRINSANFYFASINIERCVAHFTTKNLSRRAWVIVLAAVVVALMFTNVFSYIMKALAWQGVLVVSWVAMMIISWVVDRGRDVEFRPGRVKVLAPGFFVWIGTSALGIALIERPTLFPTLSALAPLVSFVLALVAFAVVRSIGLSGRRTTAPDPVREQLADPWAVRVLCSRCGLHYVGIEMDVDDRGSVLCLECQ